MAVLSPEVLKAELRKEIEMRYPLSHDEIIEIADLYGTTEEIVVHAINDYEIEKEKEQDEDLTDYVKNVLHNMDLSIDEPTPTFEEFYKAFEKMYGVEDEYITKANLKNKFEELTTDPKQLKLFEIRSIVRKMISEQLDSNSLFSTIQAAHYLLSKFNTMKSNEIITPAMITGWKKIHEKLLKELENASPESLDLLQKLEFIFNEIVMEKGVIRNLDRQAIPGYIEAAKNFLQNKKK